MAQTIIQIANIVKEPKWLITNLISGVVWLKIIFRNKQVNCRMSFLTDALRALPKRFRGPACTTVALITEGFG